MMGMYSEWSSSVVKGVIELARKKRMRIGYLEFNHNSENTRKTPGFSPGTTCGWKGWRRVRSCSGNTNYEKALEEALKEFRGRGA